MQANPPNESDASEELNPFHPLVRKVGRMENGPDKSQMDSLLDGSSSIHEWPPRQPWPGRMPPIVACSCPRQNTTLDWERIAWLSVQFLGVTILHPTLLIGNKKNSFFLCFKSANISCAVHLCHLIITSFEPLGFQADSIDPSLGKHSPRLLSPRTQGLGSTNVG